MNRILNKITPDKFHKLSEELISAGLDSPSILKGVIMLIFNKALEEPKYSSMYAQLCRKLSEGVPNFDPQSPPTARSTEYPNTFCRFLLRKCEAEFSNRCNASEAFGEGPLSEEEEELRDIAKKKMLGNIKFICELGKQNLADEFILHRCIQQLCKKKVDLKNKAEDLECLCQIMKTVGRLLDTEKGKTLMDQYFVRMDKYAHSNDLPMRYRFMLQDVLDLRKNKWVPRIIQRDQNPKTITQIREEAGRDYTYPPANPSFTGGFPPLAGQSGPPIRPADRPTAGYYGGTSQRALDDMHGASLPSFGNSMGNPIHNSLMLDHDPIGPSFGGPIKTPFNQYSPNGMYAKKPTGPKDAVISNPIAAGVQTRDAGTGNRESLNTVRDAEVPPRFARAEPRSGDNSERNRDSTVRGDVKEVGGGEQNRYTSGRNMQSMTDSRGPGKFVPNSGPNQRPMNTPNSSGDRSYAGNSNAPVSFNKSANLSGNRELPPRFQRMQMQQQGQGPSGNQFQSHSNSGNTIPHHRNDFGAQQQAQRNFHSNPSDQPGYGRNNEVRIVRPNGSNPNQQIPPTGVSNTVTLPNPPINRPIIPSLTAFNAMDSKEISLRPARNSILLKSSNTVSPQKLEPDAAVHVEPKSTEPDRARTSVVLNKLVEKPVAPVAPAAPVFSAKELLAEKVNKILGDLLAAEVGKDEAVKELQKLIEESNSNVEVLRLLMEKSAEREEQERERASEFIVYLKEVDFVQPADFVSAYRALLARMGALEADVPKIKSIIAGNMAHTVGSGIITLQEAFKLSERSHLHPLFLLCLQQLNTRHGEQWLLEQYENSGIDLMRALPECDRNKERLCEILKDRQLSFLQPLLRIESELQALIGESGGQELTPAVLYRWIKDNVDVKLQQSTAFIGILFSALAKFVSDRCDAQVVENEEPAQADKKLLHSYKQLMEKFAQVLQSFLVDRQDLQLSALYALQTYAHLLSFPKGLILRWFILLYELDIVDGDVFLKWKEEVNDEFPDKGKALFQVNVWLTWLEKAEQDEEEDDEDEEDDE